MLSQPTGVWELGEPAYAARPMPQKGRLNGLGLVGEPALVLVLERDQIGILGRGIRDEVEGD